MYFVGGKYLPLGGNGTEVISHVWVLQRVRCCYRW
jgi:hypothetical protein